MRHIPRLRVGLLLIAAFVVKAPAGALAAPCAPGTAATPTFDAWDESDLWFIPGGTSANPTHDRTLTATHEIEASAVFPPSPETFNEEMTGPPGVRVLARNGSGMTLRPDTPGPLPLTVTWEQEEGKNGVCSASASTALQIVAAKPLRPNSLRRPTSLAVDWAIPKPGLNSDLRRIEVRLRSRRGLKLPTARAPFKVFTIPLREGDRETGSRPLRNALVDVDFGSSGKSFGLSIETSHQFKTVRVGYEVQVFQGDKRIGRVRATANCRLFAGTCTYPIFRVER